MRRASLSSKWQAAHDKSLTGLLTLSWARMKLFRSRNLFIFGSLEWGSLAPWECFEGHFQTCVKSAKQIPFVHSYWATYGYLRRIVILTPPWNSLWYFSEHNRDLSAAAMRRSDGYPKHCACETYGLNQALIWPTSPNEDARPFAAWFPKTLPRALNRYMGIGLIACNINSQIVRIQGVQHHRSSRTHPYGAPRGTPQAVGPTLNSLLFFLRKAQRHKGTLMSIALKTERKWNPYYFSYAKHKGTLMSIALKTKRKNE